MVPMEDIKRLEAELAKKKQEVLKELLRQRDELDKQIAELQGSTKKRGRKPGSKSSGK